MSVVEILNNFSTLRKWLKKTPGKVKEHLDNEQLASIEIAEGNNRDRAKTKWNAMLVEAEEKFPGSDYILYLKQALLSYGLGEILEEALEVAEVPDGPEDPDGQEFFDPLTYRFIIPLCRAAHYHEKNGVAEEHAKLLSTVFNDKEKVFDYLQNFQSRNPKCVNLVHDACLFELPPSDGNHYWHWIKLANNKDMMLNPRFRELLPFSEVLSGMVASNRSEISSDTKKRINDIKSEISKCSQDYKKLARKPVDKLSEEERRERPEKLKKLKKEKANYRLQLVELSKTKTLDEIGRDIITWRAFYEKYQLESIERNESQRIFIENGLAEKDINKFYSLKPANDDIAIPNVIIDGSEIGYPEYYLKKLDVMNNKGAAIAACLGKLTKCCQHLGGAGNSCVIHGITSPFGGFYVLCKGDAKNPDLNDEILAQSWAWRGRDNALCIDSVELSRGADSASMHPIVSDIYRYFAHVLCTRQEFSQHVNRINIGSQSGISRRVGFNDYPTPVSYPRDYNDYRDSHSQFLLACSHMPYLFFKKIKSNLLQTILKNDSEAMFQKVLNEKPIINNEEIKIAIAFAIQTKNEELLGVLKSTINSADDVFFQELIIANKAYLESLDKNEINFDLLNKDAYINARNSSGKTALHIAIEKGDIECVKKLIDLDVNPNIQDNIGDSALIFALEYALYQKNLEHGREMVRILIDHKAEINLNNTSENTALIIAVKNSDYEMVQYLVENGADIDISDANFKTAIYWAVEKGNSDIFHYLLEKKARINVVSLLEENTLLMIALKSRNINILSTLLDNRDESVSLQISAFINAINSQGKTALHIVTENRDIESIKKLIALGVNVNACNKDGNSALICALEDFPGLNERENGNEVAKILIKNKAGIDVKNKNENTPLNIAVKNNNLEMVRYLVESGANIEIPDAHLKTAIYWAVEKGNSDIFHYLLEKKARVNIVSYPEGDSLLFSAMKKGDVNILATLFKSPDISPEERNAALIKILNKPPHHIVYIFELLSKKQMLSFIDLINNANEMEVLLRGNFQLFLLCIKSISQEGLLSLLRCKEGNNSALLEMVLKNNPSEIGEIISLIPEEKRVDLLGSVGKENHCFLYNISEASPGSFNKVLTLLPEEKRFEMLSVKVSLQGDTLMHKLAQLKGINFNGVLELLTEVDRLTSLLSVNERNSSVIDYILAYNKVILLSVIQFFSKEQQCAIIENRPQLLYRCASDYKALQYIYNLYPPEQQQLFASGDENSLYLLFMATKNPDSFKMIFELYPKEQRFLMLNAQNKQHSTAFSQVIQNPTLFLLTLELLAEEHRLELMQSCRVYSKSVLKPSLPTVDFFRAVLKLIPENQQEQACKLFGKNDEDIMSLVSKDRNYCLAYLESLPQDKRFDKIKTMGHTESTVVRLLSHDGSTFHDMLTLLPEKEQLAAIELANKACGSVLHNLFDSFGSFGSFELIFKRYPQEKRLQALLDLDEYGMSILDLSNRQPKSVPALLQLLSNEDRVKAINEIFKFACLSSTESPRFLNIIEELEVLKEVCALSSEEQQAHLVIYLIKVAFAEQKIEIYQNFINSFPENEQIKLLANPLLLKNIAETNPSWIALLIKNLSEEQKFILLKVINEEKLVNLSCNDEFLCIDDYTQILRILRSNENSSLPSFFARKLTPEDVQFIKAIKDATSFDEVTLLTIQYLTQQASNPIALEIMGALVGVEPNYEKALNRLKSQWGINEQEQPGLQGRYGLTS